jgi:hypothetical protein
MHKLSTILTVSTVRGGGSAQCEYVLLEDIRHTVAHALLHPVHAERLAHAPNHHTKDTVSKFVGHGGGVL